VKRRYHAPLVIGFVDELYHMLLTHEKYVHPDVALEFDEIFVLNCDTKHIWFSITDPKVKMQENSGLIVHLDESLRPNGESLPQHRSSNVSGKTLDHASLGILQTS